MSNPRIDQCIRNISFARTDFAVTRNSFLRRLEKFEQTVTRNCVLDKRTLTDEEDAQIEQLISDNEDVKNRYNEKKQMLIAKLLEELFVHPIDVEQEIIHTLNLLGALKTRFLDNRQSMSKCIVCLNGVAHYALVPCGHKISCTECIDKLMDKPCPTCRMVADGSIRIFD